MKSTRHALCFIMVIVVCMTMAITAFAGSASASAGIYGKLSGSSYQSAGYLPTTTTVTTNPDSAKLRVYIETTTSTGGYVASTTKNSATGVTSFSYTYPIVYHPDALPTKASCKHYVISDDYIYIATSATSLDTSYFT